MADRKPYLLRLDSELKEALEKWASDELRSLNGQIEFLLHDALRRAGRLTRKGAARRPGPGEARSG